MASDYITDFSGLKLSDIRGRNRTMSENELSNKQPKSTRPDFDALLAMAYDGVDRRLDGNITAKAKKTRLPSYKKDERVDTPEGIGNIWSIDRDGIVCVELDSDIGVLHEFDKKELRKVK